MNPTLRIARTEILEHQRQPLMLVAMALSYPLLIAIFWSLLYTLDVVLADPEQTRQIFAQLQQLGVNLDPEEIGTLVHGVLLTYFTALIAFQPVFVVYFAAYSVLHDRDNGVLPFVMLAPLSRTQLLLGKLLGCMALPTLLHVVFVTLACLPLLSLSVVEGHGPLLGGDPVWWAIVLLVNPSFTALIGALGTVISSATRDIRTSLQIMSLCNWIISIGFSAVVVQSMDLGVMVQLALAAGCLTLCAVVVGVGGRLMERESFSL